MLFDISGIKDGWGKINKGLIKMYDAEVLSKFPVVQHFPFGRILRWEKDPDAKMPVQSTHQSSQPLRDPMGGGGSVNVSSVRPPGALGGGVGTAAPWASGAGTKAPPPPAGFVNGVTQAPWAKSSGGGAGAGVGGRMPPPSSLRQPQGRPMHSQASQSSSKSSYGLQSLQPSGRPVSAATAGEEKLADKTAETIPEKIEEEG